MWTSSCVVESWYDGMHPHSLINFLLINARNQEFSVYFKEEGNLWLGFSARVQASPITTSSGYQLYKFFLGWNCEKWTISCKLEENVIKHDHFVHINVLFSRFCPREELWLVSNNKWFPRWVVLLSETPI